jgi:hypothetical protein
MYSWDIHTFGDNYCNMPIFFHSSFQYLKKIQYILIFFYYEKLNIKIQYFIALYFLVERQLLLVYTKNIHMQSMKT